MLSGGKVALSGVGARPCCLQTSYGKVSLGWEMFQAIVTRVFIILLQRSLIDLHLLRTPREVGQVLSVSWTPFRKGFSFR